MLQDASSPVATCAKPLCERRIDVQTLPRSNSASKGIAAPAGAALFCESVMYAAVLSGCLFAAALVPAVPLKTGRVPVSRIMRQPGLSWTGLYDELGRPVTMDELRRHKFPTMGRSRSTIHGGT